MGFAMADDSPRRVIVVEDHLVLAELIAQAFDDETDLECVGVATDLEPALTLVAHALPDTAIVDAQLPSGDGVALVERLREVAPGVRVIILTAQPRPARERAALAAGAVGYLGKDGRLADLVAAVRHATPETPARDPGLLARAAAAASRPGLSPRELEVLGLLAEGRHVTDISAALGLSDHTTRGYVKSILAKLRVRSQLEAVAVAAREGLVRVG